MDVSGGFMKTITAIFIILFIFTGCAINPETVAKREKFNNDLKKVFNISEGSEKEKFECTFISLETVGIGAGFTTAGDMSRAVRKSKVIAVRKGGNATRLLMSSSNWDASSVTFEVLKCNKSPFDN